VGRDEVRRLRVGFAKPALGRRRDSARR